MSRLTNLLLLLPALLLTVTPARALEILSPADGAVVSKTTRLVIKGGDKPVVDAIMITINGEKSDLLDISAAAYRQSFRDFVFLEAGYDPGVNQLEVEGYAGGKRVAAAKAKVYLPEGVIEPPAPFAFKPFHTAEREALCTGCHHNMNPDAKALANPVPVQNPCGSCHGALLNAKHVHGPAGVYDCVACHDPQSRPAKYAQPDIEGRFCLECHDDVLTAARKEPFVHGPVDSGHCLACHDPHASDAPGLMRGATLNQGCLVCHEKVGTEVHAIRSVTGTSHKLEGPRNPAAPGKPFHCASCHAPHGAKTQGLLQGAAAGFSFCSQCHKK